MIYRIVEIIIQVDISFSAFKNALSLFMTSDVHCIYKIKSIGITHLCRIYSTSLSKGRFIPLFWRM